MRTKTLKKAKVMPFSLRETSKSLSENSLHRHWTKGKLSYKRKHLHWWGILVHGLDVESIEETSNFKLYIFFLIFCAQNVLPFCFMSHD